MFELELGDRMGSLEKRLEHEITFLRGSVQTKADTTTLHLFLDMLEKVRSALALTLAAHTDSRLLNRWILA